MIGEAGVRLGAVECEDLPTFQRWLHNVDVTHEVTHYLPLSRDEAERSYAALPNETPEESPLAVEILRPEGWQLAGNARQLHQSWIQRIAGSGIVNGDKTLSDRGRGTKALQLMWAHGLETLNRNRICLHVDANNARARQSYDEAGFVVEGPLHQAMFRRGHHADIIVVGIVGSEWKKRLEGS